MYRPPHSPFFRHRNNSGRKLFLFFCSFSHPAHIDPSVMSLYMVYYSVSIISSPHLFSGLLNPPWRWRLHVCPKLRNKLTTRQEPVGRSFEHPPEPSLKHVWTFFTILIFSLHTFNNISMYFSDVSSAPVPRNFMLHLNHLYSPWRQRRNFLPKLRDEHRIGRDTVFRKPLVLTTFLTVFYARPTSCY